MCERLRRLRDKQAKWDSQRDKAFKSRDAADAALNELGSNETKKRTEHLADYGEACRKIKDLDHKLRDGAKALDQTIEYADQGELFPDADTFNEPEDDETGEDQSELKDTRPLGRVGAGA